MSKARREAARRGEDEAATKFRYWVRGRARCQVRAVRSGSAVPATPASPSAPERTSAITVVSIHPHWDVGVRAGHAARQHPRESNFPGIGPITAAC